MGTLYRENATHDEKIAGVIGELARTGITQSIVTSLSKKQWLAVSEKLALPEVFTHVLTAEDMPRGKSDPEVYRHMIALSGLPAKQNVFVSDLWGRDLRGAHAAGIRTILVGEKTGTPDAVVASALEVPYTCQYLFQNS